jgi:hypothetical protein
MNRWIVMSLFLTACAAPGETRKIPQPVAIALAGGDLSSLPAEAWSKDAPQVEIDVRWYDRVVSLWIEHGEHLTEFTSDANGASAVADNRTRAGVAEVYANLFMRLAEAYAGRSSPVVPPIVPQDSNPPGSTLVLEAIHHMEERLAALEAQGSSEDAEAHNPGSAGSTSAPATIPEDDG